MKKSILLVTLMPWLMQMVHADEVQLKNGDRMTGVIAKADGKKLTLKTEAAGDVSLSLEAVESFLTEGRVYLSTLDGKIIDGKVRYGDNAFHVQEGEADARTLPAGSVTMLRSPKIYEAEVLKYEKAGMFDLWSGFVEAGLSLSRGNSETTNLTIGANATRTAPKNKTSLYLTSLYSKSDVSGESETTANSVRGGGRYEANLTARLTVFGFSDVEHDEFQNLDIRWVQGGGIGWYLAKREGLQLQAFGGASYNYENFSDDTTRSSGEALFGGQFDYKLTDLVTVTERFVVFSNLSETGEYRMNFDASLHIKINDRLGWQFSFSDRYLSNPVGGAMSNDILLSTGIRFNF